MGQRPLGRRPDRPQRMAPAGLPYAHRLSSPRNDVARPERPGGSTSKFRQARYRHVYLSVRRPSLLFCKPAAP